MFKSCRYRETMKTYLVLLLWNEYIFSKIKSVEKGAKKHLPWYCWYYHSHYCNSIRLDFLLVIGRPAADGAPSLRLPSGPEHSGQSPRTHRLRGARRTPSSARIFPAGLSPGYGVQKFTVGIHSRFFHSDTEYRNL